MILSTDFRKQFNFREKCFSSCQERDVTRHESCMTHVHTAWISDVDSVMFVNRIRKMVSFGLGKEIEKDVIHEFRNGPRSL